MSSTMNRRRFLGHGAVVSVALAASSGSVVPAAEPGEPAIIDTHQHLWDLKRLRLAWLDSSKSKTLNRSFLPEDYRRATAGLNVVKSVYMEVDAAPAHQEVEARWIVDLIKGRQTKTVAAVISGRPASTGFKDYLGQFRDVPEIKGMRQVLHSGETPAGYCLDPKFVRGIRLLGEIGWSFDLCMRPGELLDGAKLALDCPGTSFILDHCGNAPVFGDREGWKTDVAEVAERKNVVCKVSGIVASTAGKTWTPDDLAPIINHVLNVFGPDRVVFGGDWPVCTLGASYRQWVEALRTVVKDRPEAERRKLFHDNAERVYRLRTV